MTMVLLLICGFQESSNLAAAYGIAVTGTMFITTCMIGVLIRRVWHWPAVARGRCSRLFFLIDRRRVFRVEPDQGARRRLVPAAGRRSIVFTLLTTWAKGRQLMIERMREAAMPIKVFIQSAANSAARVPGTAVFMTSTADGVPHALLHNLKHNKVLHERVILLTVKIADVPVSCPTSDRVEAARIWARASTAWCCATASWRSPTCPRALKHGPRAAAPSSR